MTTTPQDHEPPAPRRRTASWRDRPEAWSAIVAVVVLVAALVTLLVIQIRDRQAQAESDAQETSAWEDRETLEWVLADTAAFLDIDAERQDEQETALTCTRNDGRDGWTYFLHPLDADPVEDSAAVLELAAERWVDQGYTVDDSRSGEITAVTPDGGVLRFIASATATRLTGETGCALVDGAPGSEDATS